MSAMTTSHYCFPYIHAIMSSFFRQCGIAFIFIYLHNLMTGMLKYISQYFLILWYIDDISYLFIHKSVLQHFFMNYIISSLLTPLFISSHHFNLCESFYVLSMIFKYVICSKIITSSLKMWECYENSMRKKTCYSNLLFVLFSTSPVIPSHALSLYMQNVPFYIEKRLIRNRMKTKCSKNLQKS